MSMLPRRRNTLTAFVVVAAGFACTATWAIGCGGAVPAPAPADAEQQIGAALDGVSAGDFTSLGRSIWIGAAGGEVLYQESPDTPRPAASSIKTAYLAEFFADRADTLDEPVRGADGGSDIPPSSTSMRTPRPRSRSILRQPPREP